MHTLRLCLTSDSNRSVGLRLYLYKGRSLVDEAEVTVDISPEEHLQEDIEETEFLYHGEWESLYHSHGL